MYQRKPIKKESFGWFEIYSLFVSVSPLSVSVAEFFALFGGRERLTISSVQCLQCSYCKL